MLGVTLTNHLSVSYHVRDVICRCGQSLYAIKVLRSHGMKEEELRLIYKSVELAKMSNASPAWWGYATAMGGATVLKVGQFCERSEEKKFFDPHFLASGGQNIA